MKRRVVITGMGAISPLGQTVPELWEGLLAGRSGVCLITRFDTTDHASKIAAEIKGFDGSKCFERKELKYLDLSHQYVLVAAGEAIGNSGLENDGYNPERTGSIIGTAHGAAHLYSQQHEILLNKGIRFLSPFCVTMMFSDMAPSLIAIKYNLKGPNYSTVAACASGTIAVGNGFRNIRGSRADIMVCGGTDADVHDFSVAGFNRLKAISTRNDEPEKASRPFDRDRDGFVIGEGSAVLILEELEHAKKRRATIYAEIIGYGSTSDAYHLTAPDPEGTSAARSMRLAVKEAGIKPEQVDYINSHGTATILGDVSETVAVKKVFGDHAYKLTVNSSKSMIGHLMGGAGAIEAIITALSLKESKIHPTINLDNPDPRCDLDYSANRVTEKNIRYALTNSFGFGGHNGTLVLKKYQD